MPESVLKKLFEEKYWDDTVSFFETRCYRQKKKLQAYQQILHSGEYLEITKKVLAENYKFKLPLKLVVNKLQTGKKKTVYLFEFRDDLLLKVINKILTEAFAQSISPACHSFQKKKGAKTAFKSLLADKEINKKYCLKTDIQNFFNSIDPKDFIDSLPEEITRDKLLVGLIKQLIMNDKARVSDKDIIEEPKGLMAGCPLSPFLSNIYLRSLDSHFVNKGVSYVRYSDDIVLFDTKEAIEEHKKTIENYLKSKHLRINHSKTGISLPGETAIFLGFSYKRGSLIYHQFRSKKCRGK